MIDFMLDQDGCHWIASDGTRLRAIRGGGSSGSTKTTVVNQIPAKTPEEIALLAKQNDILDIQISELKRQNEALEAVFPEQKKLLAAQTESAIAAAEFTREQTRFALETGLPLQKQLIEKAVADLEVTPEEREIRTLSNQRALAILRGESPPLLPGQQERINTVFGRAAEEAQMGLRTFGEDLAASRGMTVSDSPIGGELLRQGEQLARGLAAAKAGAELNVGQTEQQFGEAVRQFQENLRQRAFQNRLALTGVAGGRSAAFDQLPVGSGGMTPIFATTTPGASMAGAQGILDTLARERLAGTTQTTRGTSSTSPGAFDYLRMAASIAGAVAASSARFKTAILPYDADEYDRALDKIRATPITRWKYKWEPKNQRPHTGPILELAPEDIRADNLRLDLLSYTGLLHAAVKAVDRNVERFGERLAAALEAA